MQKGMKTLHTVVFFRFFTISIVYHFISNFNPLIIKILLRFTIIPWSFDRFIFIRYFFSVEQSILGYRHADGMDSVIPLRRNPLSITATYHTTFHPR